MADEPLNLSTPVPPTPPEAPEKKLPQDRLSTLRTYQEDAQRVIRGENLSLASMALKERARALERSEEAPTEDSHRTRNIILGSLSALLILGGIGAISYFVFFRTTEEPTVVDTRIQSMIFADTDTVIDIKGSTGDAILKQIRRSFSASRTLGTVENVLLAEKTISETGEGTTLGLSADQFFRFLVAKAPDAFARLLDGPYMYGIHGYAKNFGFILAETTNPERVYSELLSWEKTSLARDLIPLLREDIDLSATETTKFQDTLLKNVDARVLRNQNNEIILVYAFLTQERLLIAGSEETFVEVLRRFTTPRPVVR